MDKWQKGARKMREGINIAAAEIPDEIAVKATAIFMSWNASATYTKDQRVRYGDYLYKCLTAHTAQAIWTPATAPSLWVCIDDPADAWPEWHQPGTVNPGGGVYSAYDIGAQVTYKGKRYISKIAANTTTPGSDARWWEEQ